MKPENPYRKNTLLWSLIECGWLICPNCKRNHRLLRVEPETQARGLPVYCRDCKTEIILNIDRGQSVERRSP